MSRDALAWNAEDRVTGRLHVVVAFDWGEEVDLTMAAQHVPAELQSLPRRRRTPSSIAYRPSPLRFRLASVDYELPEVGRATAEVEVTVFDFAAVNVVLKFPLDVHPEPLRMLAGGLSQPEPLVALAREAAGPLFERLLPAIRLPRWSEFSEEYFVFELQPAGPLAQPRSLLTVAPQWLAALVRLETEPLCEEEIAEALRQRISYGERDLVVLEWSAAVVLDQDCAETLETIEFANLQLLELRLVDERVDRAIVSAYRLIQERARSWLPFWRTFAQPLRALREIRIDAVGLLERANNALKLVGDQYVARVFRLLTERLRLEEWSANIRESLDVADSVHEILSGQSATYRIEFLEIIVIVLILIEVVMIWGGH